MADRGPTLVGRLVACEDEAEFELLPEPVPEVEAVVSAEVDAFDGLTLDRSVEAQASLRVLLAEPDDAATGVGIPDRYRETAADTLREIVHEAALADG